MSDNILKLLGVTSHVKHYEIAVPFIHFPSFFHNITEDEVKNVLYCLKNILIQIHKLR